LIDGLATKEGATWIARIYVRDTGGKMMGSRELRSDAADCAALGDAVVLAVALGIDPEVPEDTTPAPAPPPAPIANAVVDPA
jgi:hypothetical protein